MPLNGARSPRHLVMALYQHCLTSLDNQTRSRVRSSNSYASSEHLNANVYFASSMDSQSDDW
jgi:hypothetical protein